MKKIMLSLVTIFFVASGFSQGIVFEEGSFTDALAKAKAENKLVFIDVYTQWCGPCKEMSQKVFVDEQLGKLYNSKYVCIKIDAEKGEGIELAKKFDVTGYPTLLYTDANGKLIHRVLGSKSAEFFIEEVAKVESFSKGVNPEEFAKRYKDGDRDSKFLLQYYKLCEQNRKQEVLNAYLMSLSDDMLFNPDNEYLGDITKYDSKLFTRLIDGLVSRRSSNKAFNFNITFPVQYQLGLFLNQSINDGNKEMFDEIMGFKKRAIVLNNSVDLDSELAEGRGPFFASDEYVQLLYAMKNSKNSEELNSQIRDYIENFMVKYPQDALVTKLNSNLSNYPEEALIMFAQVLITTNSYSCLYLMNCVEHYWRKSKTTKTLVSECAKWSKYFYEINPLNYEVALKSANILYRIGKSKDAITLLNKAIGYQEKYSTKKSGSIEMLSGLLHDIENKK